MKFRTEYLPGKPKLYLDPTEPVILLGSCFADNIGRRMSLCRWDTLVNPCGTLYNPSSISKILRLALSQDDISETIRESVACRDNLVVSWLMDSHASTYSTVETIRNVSQRVKSLSAYLRKAGTLIITFGTAWVYELRETPGYIVSNCHKFSPDTFLRRRLKVCEIVEEWSELLGVLRRYNPVMRVLFTVSPVRHLKDGFEGNSRSKAILQLACEELCDTAGEVFYFPSYEIMNDDLRDYRYYAPDMVHPSEVAVEYIWEKFQQSYLSPESQRMLKDGERETKRLNHRPIIS
ncbi:MAG: GSCFA domain-containing protein [Muribaculaceae bacterium]|nr:GSCFA domain-containing protein [Muribaculaceae bacterium]